jgi:hypothetical protein
MRRALLLNGYLHCLAFIVGMDLFWLVGSILRVRVRLKTSASLLCFWLRVAVVLCV